MAPISRRPRPMLCLSLTLSLLAAACSLVKPAEETPVPEPTQANALATAGNHAEAARAYAKLAVETPAEHDSYQLLSAEQWVSAGDLAAAKQAFAAVSPEARLKQPASRALVAAEIAVGENDGPRALRELDGIAPPQSPDLAQNYWYLRGVAAFQAGRPVDGTTAFVERERYLTDTAALRASRDQLYNRIRTAAEHGQPLTPPAKAEPVIAGWLHLGPVAAELQRDPLHAESALNNWRRLYPQHPANDTLAGLAHSQNPVPVAALQFPDQIALLLPLSGRAEAVGMAVRDGFIAAYLEQPVAARPRLKIYDVAVDGAAASYQHAIQDGAAFVVGPLTKEDVAAIAPLAAGHAPVLALNFLADSVTAPANFYQFALLPEDEARSVARRLATEGKLDGVVILPDGEWGSRVGAAFADELKHLGGNVLDTGRYESGRADFSAVIRQTLQVHEAKGEQSTHRTDAAFAFIAGTPSAERLLVSQMKFHFAGDVPVYATSDSFEPSTSANGDLDGMTFPDMPWMISADPETARIRDAVRGAWPARAARRDRLYAFGCDAYRLVPVLQSKALGGSAEISGVTGRLRLDERNHVRRELDWAQIRGGAPTAL